MGTLGQHVYGLSLSLLRRDSVWRHALLLIVCSGIFVWDARTMISLLRQGMRGVRDPVATRAPQTLWGFGGA